MSSYSHGRAVTRCLPIAVLSAMIFAGCGASDSAGTSNVETPSAEMTPEAAMEQWRAMMETPGKSLENPNLKRLAWSLSQSSPQYVQEMVAGLDAPDLSDETMLALVSSLEEVMTPDLVPRMAELTAEDKPAKVRGAATYLIGKVHSESATKALHELREDPDEIVRFSVLLGLAERGDQEARAALREIHADEHTAALTRERILLTAAAAPSEADRPMFEHAVKTAEYEEATYKAVILALGRIGTEESIEALNQLQAHPESTERLQTLCDDAIAAIAERSVAPGGDPA